MYYFGPGPAAFLQTDILKLYRIILFIIHYSIDVPFTYGIYDPSVWSDCYVAFQYVRPMNFISIGINYSLLIISRFRPT